MTFLAPWFLMVAAAVGAMVVALHLLARQRPRIAPLPTARFVPERPAVAPSRATRPTDLLVLAVRVLAVLMVGAAFARPQWTGERRSVGRVVILDRSRAVASLPEARDSASAILEPGDVLVLFDSAARVVQDPSPDSLGIVAPSRSPGSLSTALIGALRAAQPLRDRVDSLELVIVSPLVAEEVDSATMRVRALWTGRARLVRVGATRDTSLTPATELRAEADDPLAATIALLGGSREGGAVRLVRTGATPGDSAWAQDSAGALVLWSRRQDSASEANGRTDSAGAVSANGVTVVAPFARLTAPASGQAIAWWNDGTVAAVERSHGSGCVREVAIGLPYAGDLVLRESFRRLVQRLTGPCGGSRDLALLSDSALAALRGSASLLRAAALPRPRAGEPAITTWLLAGALTLVLAEMLLRRRGAGG